MITSNSATALQMNGASMRVSDLTIEHTGSGFGLYFFSSNSSIDHVQVNSSGTNAACYVGVAMTMRDSLCVASANGARAVWDEFNGNSFSSKLRNVTAIATGANSIGVRIAAGGSTTNTVDARNVIASGTATDVQAINDRPRRHRGGDVAELQLR